MKFKIVIFVALFLSTWINAQDVKEVRTQYPKAVSNAEIAAKLDGELSTVTSSGKPVLLAYKGAVLTLKAKFAKKKSDKKDFFKEGVALIESAVSADASNIEIRYIRLSVQENSPKFLGYHKNIEEDKEFILKHYGSISSAELKEIVKDFAMKSENFDETEKKSFQ
ncbi:hypothetical protein POV26_00295 [Aequorivita todarodis]|uniref:hypothetical protein n=1 Tax=Aequorivita todarodis TaxID=2036821 RepID=UPI0023503129|nr:hypothetical protein [Aequorivita todarodis]MDC7999467.1 hypothetical protein [Aequorivita todarodis]